MNEAEKLLRDAEVTAAAVESYTREKDSSFPSSGDVGTTSRADAHKRCIDAARLAGAQVMNCLAKKVIAAHIIDSGADSGRLWSSRSIYLAGELECIAQQVVALHVRCSLLAAHPTSLAPPLSTPLDASEHDSITPEDLSTGSKTLNKNTCGTVESEISHGVMRYGLGATRGFGAVVVTKAPARIDWAGGWSDTPPICYEQSGAVSLRSLHHI